MRQSTFVPGIERRQENGASAVEFALVSLILMTLLLGMLQYGWYFYTAQSTSAAAREGARRIAVGDCLGDSPNQLLSFVQAQTPMATSASYTPSTPAPGDDVTVTVTASGGIIHFLPMPADGDVTRTFVARVEDTEPSGADC